ncbi:C-type lectin domain family 10 member A-like, partial [Coregonus clupeaformis]|uniref:C-type lectin domain family 10 member A-like n=1 Tax=Coregonus clupeaformis TaxID=59861 RepID=UPI001E1C73AC
MQTMDIDDDTYPNKPSVTFSANFQWWKRPSGVAAVCLGLLCVLLLAGIMGLSVYCKFRRTTERDQLQNSLNTRTKERDQLQNSLTTRTKDRDQQKDRLNVMTAERDQLNNNLNSRTKERDQLKNSLNTRTTERDQLQNSLTTKTKERDQLQNNLTTITLERDQLQNSLNTRTTERDQLQNSLTTKTKERDQLQNSLNTRTTERDQLNTSLWSYEKPCLNEWWKFGTSCYYVSSTRDSGGDGQRQCRVMGADLVVINSREEQIFINGFKKNVWIGAYKKDGIWKWVDDTAFKPTYWMEGEPSNLNDKVACIEISQMASDPLKSWK